MVVDAKSKERKKYRYENMMTPYEKLKSLPGWEQYLKEETAPHALESKTESMSDNEAAEQLQSARESCLKLFLNERPEMY